MTSFPSALCSVLCFALQYKAILSAHQAAVEALVDGAEMSAAHAAVVQTLKEKGQDNLIAHLGKSVGHGIGLELRESSNILNAKNNRLVQAGMVFNVCVGVEVLHPLPLYSRPRPPLPCVFTLLLFWLSLPLLTPLHSLCLL